jgi:hypothetical protein
VRGACRGEIAAYGADFFFRGAALRLLALRLGSGAVSLPLSGSIQVSTST